MNLNRQATVKEIRIAIGIYVAIVIVILINS